MTPAGTGCFYARHTLFGEARCREALAWARAFFDLPQAEKQSLAIERSPHFRGYSQMRSDRDWREQIHLGREQPDGGHPLRGPNLWPAGDAWRTGALKLLADFETAGRDILKDLAAGAGLPPEPLLAETEEPYVLLKLIRYLGTEDGQPQSGVAPHTDFSWITLILQDDSGGLEVQAQDGSWQAVEPIPGTLVVNTGELLEFATGGRLPATPHRVVSRPGPRVSLPFFLNPGLSTRVEVLLPPQPRRPEQAGHVHRVLPEGASEPFCYGDAEWRRKGEGVWCHACCATTATR